jgi:hypothetical protein
MAPFGASPSFEVKSFDSDDNPSTPAKGGAISPRDPGVGPIRRFGAKPGKNLVDLQAAIPSSWKTPCMADRRAW